MAPAKQRALAVGDIVSVAVRHFGKDYAQKIAGRRWASEKQRCEGMVVDKDGDCWAVEFSDMQEPIKLKRHLLAFVRRDDVPAQPGDKDAALDVDSSADEEDAQQVQPRRSAAASRSARAAGRAARSRAVIQDSSSDSSSDDSDLSTDVNPPGDDNDGQWTRADDFAMDERARHGYHNFSTPMFNMPDYQNASFFAICMYWLSATMEFHDKDVSNTPPSFLQAMADEMQAAGRQKASGASDRWAQWTVSYQDLIQWIGCWYYMLAFPQAGSREDYFRSQPFGPAHDIAAVMKHAENGKHKGRRWFVSMHACFRLPTGTIDEDDAFAPVTCMWESYRRHCVSCVTPGTLLLLDESMVKWVGRSMPGLMVVQRKPTPMGAELHTMCCAESGILVNYELYEGRERMEKKEWSNVHPKHVALTMRCCQPYFGTVCSQLACLFAPCHVCYSRLLVCAPM